MSDIRAKSWFELHDLEIRYWHDVNCNFGQSAHDFYVKDGIFAVGDSRHEGRAAIKTFYAWRRERGARVARHCVSNIMVEVDPSGRVATVQGIVCLYGADGSPVFESRPPTMIADIRNECILEDDGRWRFKSHFLVPLFRGEGRLDTRGR